MNDYEKKVARAIRLLKSIPTDEGPVEVLPDSVVYCDPPYRNTASYSGMEGFSHEDFYS